MYPLPERQANFGPSIKVTASKLHLQGEVVKCRAGIKSRPIRKLPHEGEGASSVSELGAITCQKSPRVRL